MASSSSSGRRVRATSTKCVACKCLRRKCVPECVLLPYFPPEQTDKFLRLHQVYRITNIMKLLQDIHPDQRQEAVNSFVYEAEQRLLDPVNGCIGIINGLEEQIRAIEADISAAKLELSRYQARATSTGLLSAEDGTLINLNDPTDMEGCVLEREKLTTTTNNDDEPSVRMGGNDTEMMVAMDGSSTNQLNDTEKSSI